MPTAMPRAYRDALDEVAAAAGNQRTGDVFARPSISVKLSALHPRYEEKQQPRVLHELLPRIEDLAVKAQAPANSGSPSMPRRPTGSTSRWSCSGAFARAPSLAGWNGLGLAVQAYGKRAYPVLEWLADLALATGRRLPVRLVKGAYWDTEIKRAQEAGYDGYPLFTRKVSTDVSYLACARLHARAPRRLLSRSSPPTMPTPSRPSRSWRATTAASNSSGCTAWARRSTARSPAPKG